VTRPAVSLGHLATERLHPLAAALDTGDARGIVRAMQAADEEAVAAVRAADDAIARLAELAAAVIGLGGKILYLGAGTSGRLGALDAVECIPTFGLAPGVFDFAIAGGDAALTAPIEGAEDDGEAGVDAVRCASERGDLVIAISASGRTPYCLGALDFARAHGRRTGFVCANAPPAGVAEVVVQLDTGPEILAGSTRLKAGTATKLALNRISTTAMALLGKTWRGRMVDVLATCEKLSDRACRIVVELGGVSEADARVLLGRAAGHVKTAVAMARLGVDHLAAREALARTQGSLGRLLDPR